MKTSWKSWMTGVAVGLISGALVVACKKDEPPPPLPSATAPPPAPTPTQLAIDETPPPDAGSDAGDGGKPKGKGTSASLTKCCTALQQNAASAPPQNQQAMLAAAGICNALAAQGKERNSIVAAIQGALRGAAMPAACR
jgi:hypothetical protein